MLPTERSSLASLSAHPVDDPLQWHRRAVRHAGRWLALAGDAGQGWIAHGAGSQGASIAYYTLFSIAPLLLIVIALAGAVFGADAARGAIVQQLDGLVGTEGAIAIQGLLGSVERHQQAGFGALLGSGLLIVGATSVVAELQAALDRIWGVPAQAQRPGWVLFLRTRLLSLGLILGVGFLLMVSLVMAAVLAAWSRWWAPVFDTWPVLLKAVNFGLDLAMSTALFAMIFKLMPSTTVRWRDVWLGAATTAVLFSVGKALIGFYIGTSGIASGFGAASSMVVLLVWVYWSAQVLLLGAEFTAVVARRAGPAASDLDVVDQPRAT